MHPPRPRPDRRYSHSSTALPTPRFRTGDSSLMRLLQLACGAAVLAAGTGCDPKTNDRDIVFIEPPMAVEKMNTPGRMFEKAARGAYVDPRSAKLYAEGHIANAIHLPLAEMAESANAKLAGYNVFIVYDTDYGDVMAKAASKRLIELGFSEVYTLQGGLKAWQKDGYAVAKGAAPGAANADAKAGTDAKPAAKTGAK